MRKTLAERFEEKVDRLTPFGPWGDCHRWTASAGSHGYGQISRDGVPVCAHVVAWELKNGPVPSGLLVCHDCDVRLCCNDFHLEPGTRADNALEAGRHPMAGATLAEAQVLTIRTLAGQGWAQKDIASTFGVSTPTISEIVNRRTWRHLEADHA